MMKQKRDTPRTIKWTDSDDCLCMEMAEHHDMSISRYFSKLVNDDKSFIDALSTNSSFNNSTQNAIPNTALQTELIAQVAVAVALAMKGVK